MIASGTSARLQWHISTDTGGTFTDCLATGPQGRTHRAKVLSNGSLRGQVLGLHGSHPQALAVHLPTQADIWEGYWFRLLGAPQTAYRVAASHLAEGWLRLEGLPPTEAAALAGQAFELTAHEEAAVLAARLVTGTPLHSPLPPCLMRLGTTRGTNALLERKTARTALLVTQGFADLPLIGTQQRPYLFALNVRKPQPVHHCTVEVAERIDAQGRVLLPLSEAEIARVAALLRSQEVEAVAIALMNSYANPLHEQQLAEQLAQAGFVAQGYSVVSQSAALAPSIRLLPRLQTAVANACLSPIVGRYLSSIAQSMGAGASQLRIMGSAGGLSLAQLFHAKDSLLSGPAGGIMGAAHIARQVGIGRIITFDMGGTSTDVARYDGAPDYQFETQVGDVSLLSPSFAIETVAAGGGSLCRFDGFRLRVGPESAGAKPGPACYGAGGGLTITDVNLLLGRLDPANFNIPLSIEAAQAALQHLLDDIETHTGHRPQAEEVLHGLVQIANEKMAEAIGRISVSKGYAPQQYTLLAFGGAGGQHACALAELLGMEQVLIPYDAGLLSAYGIGQASIARQAVRQVLQPLPLFAARYTEIAEALAQQALGELAAEGIAPEACQLENVKVFARFQGQDHSLELTLPAVSLPAPQVAEALAGQFRQVYEQLFGHWVANREIEVESVRVMAAERAPQASLAAAAPPRYTPVPERKRGEMGLYTWENLQAGACLQGPALVLSQNCTVLVGSGWDFALDAANNALLTRRAQAAPQAQSHVEAIQLELFTNRFRSVAEEMGALLQRTSFSVNVKERLDFSCALLDAEGYLVVNAPHIPVHLGSLGVCVRRVVAHLGALAPGDVVITNHPAFGGSHLPDVTLIAPVYVESQLVGYVANRAHHSEIGGKRPGSMPPDATSLAEEGVVIAPMLLVRAGEAQWQAIQQVLCAPPYPSRALAENLADLEAALASIKAGQAKLQSLCAQFGTAQVSHYMQAIKAHARDCMRQSLEQLGDGIYAAEELLDDGHKLCVRITVAQGHARIDFSGTSPVHPGNLNATPAIVNSVAMYALRLLVGVYLPAHDIPLNEGLMQAVSLHLPPACMLNPEFAAEAAQCPAVVGGNTETSQRLTDTLLKAFGLAACSYGSMNNLLFGNAQFGYYETIGGGTGAGPGFAGADAVHQHMTNTRLTDPEIMERRYPVRVEKFAIRAHSGGAGQWNGGGGIHRELVFLSPVQLSVLTQHRRIPPYGLHGGQSGALGEQYLVRANGQREALQGIDQAEMQPGDRIVMLTPGGGGYGTPRSV